jgi:hypothetical protein
MLGRHRSRGTHAVSFSQTTFRLGVLGLALAIAGPGAWAQQFIDQQAFRFPQPALEEYTNQLAFADIDGDGDLDIAFANGEGYSALGALLKLRIFVNDGTGHFTDKSDAAIPPSGLMLCARDVEFGDVDGDGDLDMVVVQDFMKLPLLLLNDGRGVFTDVTSTHMPGVPLSSSHAGFGDVDNDGDLDLVLTHGGASRFGSGQTQLYLNDGTGHFSDATAARMPAQLVNQPMDVQFGDVDGDLDLDILIASRGPAGSKLYRNDGAGYFTDVTDVDLPVAFTGTVYGFELGDFNGDGSLDIVGANAKAGGLALGGLKEAVFTNDGTGHFIEVTETALPINPSADDNDPRWFDLNNDGKLDLLIASLSNPLAETPERAYINNGAGQLILTDGIFQPIFDSSLDIEVGDLDGDGRLDVVTGQGEFGSFINRMYMNNGPADTIPPNIVKVQTVGDSLNPGPYVLRAVVRDGMTTDSGFFYDSIAVVSTVNGGAPITQETRWCGGDMYRGAIPTQPCGATISYAIRATDAAGNTATSGSQTFKVLVPPKVDINTDGKIDQSDLGLLLAHYGCVGGACIGDVDSDGDVDQGDLGALLGAYGCGT